MSGLYKNYATDSKKENEGVPIEFAANDDGSIPTFIVARSADSNKAYTKYSEQALKPYRRQIQLKTLPQEKDEEIYLDVFVTTIIKGWSNVQDENGNSLEYTKPNAKKLMQDLPEVYKALREAAANVELYKLEALEEDAKN